jgi:hypothetical protein
MVTGISHNTLQERELVRDRALPKLPGLFIQCGQKHYKSFDLQAIKAFSSEAPA